MTEFYPRARSPLPGLWGEIGDGRSRLKQIETQMGRWVYVTPIAPATVPDDFYANDPLSVPFQNGITNLAGQQPLAFRVFPSTKLEILGGLDLHGASLPVIVCTLPATLWPRNDHPFDHPSTDSLALWSYRLDSTGNLWVVKQLVPP